MTSKDTENYLNLLKIYIFLLLYVHDEYVGGRVCMPPWVCGGQGTDNCVEAFPSSTFTCRSNFYRQTCATSIALAEPSF